MLALAPSPEGTTRKRRWPGDSSPEAAHLLAVAPKRRYAEPRRNLEGWVAHLRTRYPTMDDQEIITALLECDSDVDATIRRLDELSLAAAARAEATGTLPQAADLPAYAPAEAPASTAASPAGSGDTTAVVNEWVDVVVREMAASADLGDARRRASGVLTAFEAAVKGDAQATRGALESALRDTALLKRAVAIQQQRHHEASVTAAQEIESLKAALAQQQSELHAAQMNAFALSVHLRQALSGPNAAGNGGPDWVA